VNSLSLPAAVHGLPIVDVIEPLMAAVATGGAVVLCAPPGAGKTTAVPLALGLGPSTPTGRLVLLEPRRLAARAAATRLAALIGEPVGRRIGLRTGEETIVSDATVIEVVTTGVLPRLAQNDPSLADMHTIVFDEFHERSIAGDLGLALAIDIREALRPDLSIVVMSATIDAKPIAALLHGDDRPTAIVHSTGRAFPVSVVWGDGSARTVTPWEQRVATTIDRALRDQSDGDVLVFCPGVPEIGRVKRALSLPTGVDVFELHGSQRAGDQDQLLQVASNARRRVILATSIAETSVTLPSVTAVVDGGLARHSQFDPRRGLGGLVTSPVSKATAEQRRGRAGRVQPGVCYRLWSETTHRAHPDQPSPEIAGADLTPLALELAAWGAADLRWIDPPNPARLVAGQTVLTALHLIDASGALTARGRDVVRLGVHPRLGAMVLAARDADNASLGVALAALLSERDLLDGAASQRSIDVADRLTILAGSAGGTHDRRRDRVRTVADRLARRASVRFSAQDALRASDRAGALIAAGYPDRIAKSRAHGLFTLTSGSGAAAPAGDALAGSPWLAIAELDQVGGSDARVTLAAALSAEDIASIVLPQATQHDEVTWRGGRIVATRRSMFGAITVTETSLANPSVELLERAIVDAVRRERLAPLPFTDDLRAWLDRVGCCHHHLGGEWPDVSVDALVATLDEWLVPFLAGIRTATDLAKVDLRNALAAVVPRHLAAELDRLVPTHINVPSGAALRVDYSVDPPVLAVKLQEMFGTATSPTLADGQVPLVLHLLSPARQPLQITADLATFWANVYPQVRSEMRGRYPRHPWPDDPLAAAPTAKTKRALARDK
jgi:ATP-dependent helicase HrpB